MMTETPKILIVDDIPANVVVIKRVLSGLDIEIIESNNGIDALSEILSHDFALVLLDVQMPEMDGYEVAESMRSIHKSKDVPIIFVTANSIEEASVLKGYASGAADYITKPINENILLSKVKIFLELYERQKKIERLLATQNEYIQRVEQAQFAAEKANLAKSEFLANMSHEIRTPLNGVIGIAELLKRQEEDDKKRHYIEVLQSSGDLLLSIVNDILDYSKIEAGEMKLESIPVDIPLLLSEMRELYVDAANKNNVDLSVSCSHEVPLISSDITRLKQILANLISNAIKFSKDDTVNVRATLKEGSGEEARILFEVQDNGIGIPEDKVDSIFETFSQADNSTTRQYGGTGLGLAICQKLIKLFGGAIGVNSEINKGSTFWFEISAPVSKNDDQEEESSELSIKTINDGQEYTILMVEDNHTNSMVQQNILDELGLKVKCVTSGFDAIDAIDAEHDKYSLILMDCTMPEMDGYETTKKIRNMEKHKNQKMIPIIALTANAMEGDEAKCLAVGMNDYLAKPVRPNPLSTKIHKWLFPENNKRTS